MSLLGRSSAAFVGMKTATRSRPGLKMEIQSVQSNRIQSLAFALVLGGISVGLTGCEAMHEAGVPGMAKYIDTETPRREEAERRTAYQETRSPKALSWLLKNRVRTGMTIREVSEVLGEDGVEEPGADWIRTSGPFNQEDDVYRWGPDAKGRTIYLVFRSKKLVNFNPYSPTFQLDELDE